MGPYLSMREIYWKHSDTCRIARVVVLSSGIFFVVNRLFMISITNTHWLQVASAKVKESQRAQEEGKMSESDVQAFTSHGDAISYSLYAEINHFQANRQQEFKIMMQNLLAEQIDFYKRVCRPISF